MSYQPVAEVRRGGLVESLHFGAAAVADPTGRLYAWWGNAEQTTFLRSSAKPFQALPLVEGGGADHFRLTPRQLALVCASHSGTDVHAEAVAELQAQVGVREADLMCGVHPPYDLETARRLRAEGRPATPNRHNCSGKHTGMLAQAAFYGEPLADYVNPDHPVQQRILHAFAAMCGLEEEQVRVGVDGCSVPTFAVPLRAAATAYARLADPSGLGPERATACHRIMQAMVSHPDMVGGPGRFDTVLMQATGGRVLSKAGAEGYRGMALPPGALGPGSPALGVAIKIADGDLGRRTDNPPGQRAGSLVALAVLRDLGLPSLGLAPELTEFDAQPQTNWRGLVVGDVRACLRLVRPA